MTFQRNKLKYKQLNKVVGHRRNCHFSKLYCCLHFPSPKKIRHTKERLDIFNQPKKNDGLNNNLAQLKKKKKKKETRPGLFGTQIWFHIISQLLEDREQKKVDIRTISIIDEVKWWQVFLKVKKKKGEGTRFPILLF